MKEHPNEPDELPDDTAPGWLAETLARMPSELARPSPATDAAILHMAREKLFRRHRRTRGAFAWTAFAAAAAIALGVFGIIRTQNPAEAPKEDEAAIILREVATLFPGHIRSILRDESGLQVILMDEPSLNQGQSVVVEVCEKGHCQEIITYVGRTVEIRGRPVTVRSDGEGQIFLQGNGISWSSGHPNALLPNLKIRTRVI